VRDVGVQGRHQVQRLHHIGAVVAGQRVVGLEVQRRVDGLDLLQQVGRFLGGMAADVQQRQHQGGELMAQGHAGKAHAAVHAGVGDQERGLAHVQVVGFDHRDLVAERRDVGQQGLDFASRLAVVQSGHQFERLLQAFEISFELGLEVGVEHNSQILIKFFFDSR